MAKIYITEFSDYVRDFGWAVPVATVPSITTQVITFTGTSAQSAVLNASTKIIRVHADAPCHLLIGSNPTATTNNLRLGSDQTEYFGVSEKNLKIAVIQGA